MSSQEKDPFGEEQDLQAWATEMGEDYEVGSQGAAGQPLHDMSTERRNALDDAITQRLRELDGLAALPDSIEQQLHRKESELDDMTDTELADWGMASVDWLEAHPDATIDDLIDGEHKNRPNPGWLA